MKRAVMIDATGANTWIGGLYYKKNVLYSLLQDDYIQHNYRIIVLVEKEFKDIYSDFAGKVKLICVNSKNPRILKAAIAAFCMIYRCKYLYPRNAGILRKIGVTSVNWIPDFQHNHYPDMFEESECTRRSLSYKGIADSELPLMLSSQDCLNDFREYYSKTKTNVYVLHFVSYIEKEIRGLSDAEEKGILDKIGVTGRRYACVMNQFWKHKNHMVVFKALEILHSRRPDDFCIVFTGKMEDYRNPHYIDELKAFLEKADIGQSVIFLGLVARKEQLAIMKNAEYVIQPSLFEGWGTVVEDAKVMDQTILLSDIPVHREQMNEKCKLFDPNNPKELADLMEQENSVLHKCDIEKGIADMKCRAKEYARAFEQMVREAEK